MKRMFLIVVPALLYAAGAGAQTLTGSTLTLNTPYNTICPNNTTSLTITNQQPAYSVSPSCPGLPTNNIVDIKRILYGSGGSPLGPASSVFVINPVGQVQVANSMRIGTTAANGSYASYKLSVDGDIIAKRCVIQVGSWADYVFEPGYTLPPLAEVEKYVGTHGHLPGVPSAADVKENGVEMGDMNKLLLQKVEEMTLYLIQLKKENEAMQKELNELKGKN